MGPEEEKKQASVDTKITGPLPSAETVIEDKFEIFKATLTAHELSLLVALNRLSTSEILLQLKEHGISNKEVWRRLERKSPNEMSLIANGRRIPGEKLRAAILEIALQEIKPGKSN